MANETSAEFHLRVAQSFVDEVDRNLEAIEQEHGSVRELERDARDVKGFWAGTRAVWSVADWIGRQEEDLTRALKQIYLAEELNPSALLGSETDIAGLRSSVFFCKGRIASSGRKFKDAIKFYEESLRYEVDQATCYNIGLCLQRSHSRKEEIIAAYERAIEVDPDSDLAVEAAKDLLRVQK